MKQVVPVVPPLSRNKIESLVNSLFKEVQPDALLGKEPVDVEKIFEFYIPDKYGIATGYTDLSQYGYGTLGYTDASVKTSDVDESLINSDEIVTIRRCRATIGHEIGHCILHVPVFRIFRSSCKEEAALYRIDRNLIKPYNDPEWQAWEVAMACLMPYPVIIKCLDSKYSVFDIAECFDVNPAFVKTRLGKLKIGL